MCVFIFRVDDWRLGRDWSTCHWRRWSVRLNKMFHRTFGRELHVPYASPSNESYCLCFWSLTGWPTLRIYHCSLFFELFNKKLNSKMQQPYQPLSPLLRWFRKSCSRSWFRMPSLIYLLISALVEDWNASRLNMAVINRIVVMRS
jgi:hypothetical protein